MGKEDKEVSLQSSLDYLKYRASCVFYDQLRGAKNMALEYDDPADFIQEYFLSNKQYYPFQEVERSEQNRLNTLFDLRTQFGRIVLAVLLIEKYFPGNQVQVSEVLQDLCTQGLIHELRTGQYNDEIEKKNLIKKILAFEDNRIVLIVNGKQFDPLDCSVTGIKDPDADKRDPWPVLMVHQIVDMALASDNLSDRLNHLERASLYCSNMILVKEQIVITKIFLGHSASKDLSDVIRIHPNARLFYAIWLEYCAPHIKNEYPTAMLNFLDNEREEYLRKKGEVDIEFIADGLPCQGVH